MQWRHHGRSELAPRSRPGNGHLGQEPVDQSASADGRNAELSIDAQFNHRRAWIIPYAVLTLRPGAGATRAEDCAAGEGRRPDSRRRRRVIDLQPNPQITQKGYSHQKGAKNHKTKSKGISLESLVPLCGCLF